jgi:hypothetical protein
MNFSEKFTDVPTDVSHKIPKEIQMNKNLVLFAYAVKCCQTPIVKTEIFWPGGKETLTAGSQRWHRGYET